MHNYIVNVWNRELKEKQAKTDGNEKLKMQFYEQEKQNLTSTTKLFESEKKRLLRVAKKLSYSTFKHNSVKWSLFDNVHRQYFKYIKNV